MNRRSNKSGDLGLGNTRSALPWRKRWEKVGDGLLDWMATSLCGESCFGKKLLIYDNDIYIYVYAIYIRLMYRYITLKFEGIDTKQIWPYDCLKEFPVSKQCFLVFSNY